MSILVVPDCSPDANTASRAATGRWFMVPPTLARHSIRGPCGPPWRRFNATTLPSRKPTNPRRSVPTGIGPVSGDATASCSVATTCVRCVRLSSASTIDPSVVAQRRVMTGASLMSDTAWVSVRIGGFTYRRPLVWLQRTIGSTPRGRKLASSAARATDGGIAWIDGVRWLYRM